MASGAAKDQAIYVDSGGVLTNITTYCTSVNLDISSNAIDVSTLGTAWRSSVKGMSAATLALAGISDPYMGTLLLYQATQTTSISFEWYPQGSASGKEKVSGELVMTGAPRSAALDDAVQWSANYTVTGPLTLGTLA